MATATSGAGGAFFCSLNVPYRVTTGSPPSSQHDRRVTRVHAWRHTSSRVRFARPPAQLHARVLPQTLLIPLQNESIELRESTHGETEPFPPSYGCRRRLSWRLCARAHWDRRHKDKGDTQGTGLGPHIDIARSHSHADDLACTLMSPAASGCPTAAHITLPHARGVMSFNRAN